MKNVKRIRCIVVLALVLAFSFCAAIFSVACGDEKPQNDKTLSLNKTAVSLTEGEKEVLTASIADAEWSSSDETVAIVKNGEVTAVKFGKAVITAKKGEKTATCDVTVKEAPQAAVNFYVTEEKTTIYKTRSAKLCAVMYYGEELIDVALLSPEWSSSDETVAAVDKNGRVTGVGEGKAVISVKVVYNGTEYTDSAEIEVKLFVVLVAETKETVIPSAKTLSGKTNSSNRAEFSFKGSDEQGNEISIDKSAASYSSSDENVATIDENGVISGKNSGSATITAVYGTESCSASVIVATAINCKEDMDRLACAAKNNEGDLWSAAHYYMLSGDIDYGGKPVSPIAVCGVEGYSWKAEYGNLNVGDISFDAIFDGGGHSIKNALIAESLTNGSYSARNCVFGYVRGTVKNLCFDGIKFETSKIMINSGIFSQMYGTVENVLVLNGEINAGAASYDAGFMASGFFAGTVAGTIRNCIVQADFTDNCGNANLGLIYSFPSGDYKIENVYGINSASWVHYYSSGAVLPEDSTHKFGSAADLFNAHSEMFGASSAFEFENGELKLKK